MLKRFLLALAVCALAFSAQGQGPTPKAGSEYLTLSPPQNTETGNKIEVLEFFWYRCPHCYSLEPALEAWVKKLPPDTQFRRLPAVFNDEWAIDARIFYALEALGEVQRLHRPLFDAVHRQGGVKQKGEAYLKWVRDWLGKQQVDVANDGVPAIAVNGRYLVSASMVRDQRSMLAVTDYLIGQSRAAARK
jgi:thiol:disulfide interchange protein DsbA